jgi:hypothetical protein
MVELDGRRRYADLMTDPMTLQATLGFALDVPRYRWELGVVGGLDCLIPREPLQSARFTGRADVRDFLEHAAERDHVALLAFVNETSGLFVEDGVHPSPEPLLRLQLESTVFERLWLLRSMRLVDIEYERWARRSVMAPRRQAKPAVEWMVGATKTLRDLLPTLRPGYADARRLSSDLSAEAMTVAWLDATVREHWLVGIPPNRWGMTPINRRATRLAPVDPVIRCKTMLGYAYAQLLIAFDERRQTLELLQAESPPVDARCQSCGVELEPWSPTTGRKRRSDAKWCKPCARRDNTRSQREHRQQAGQMPA